jgi:hypothetical protein
MEAGGPLLDNEDLFNELITRLGEAGYAEDDIRWAENTKPPADAAEFATETIFVICNSGMKHTVARQIFDKCMAAIAAGESCTTVFGHKGKAEAMDLIWATRDQLFHDFLAAGDKIDFCQSIPWIGGITRFHLAKNFGAQVAKPDVHLVRVAERHATNPQDLCERISASSGYKINTVDLILWRACAVGILDGRTCQLIEPEPPAPEPMHFQNELFEPVQIDLFT